MISSVALPTLPTVPNNGRGHLVADVAFNEPVTKPAQLGSIPQTNWNMGLDYPEFVKNEGDKCNVPNGWPVWVNNPVKDATGNVQMANQSTHFDVKPASPTAYAIGFGTLGAVVGGAVGGLIAGLAFGAPTLGIVGASLVSGAIVGGGSAKIAANVAGHDRIRLKWEETPIVDRKLAGYIHYYGDQNNPHLYRPEYEETKLGTYFAPVVEHHRE